MKNALAKIAGVASCGDDSVILNTIGNAKIESKKLSSYCTKCVYLHVGQGNSNCHKLKIHKREMI